MRHPSGLCRAEPFFQDGKLGAGDLLFPYPTSEEGGGVGIDLRLPLGALFGVLGLLLTLYGAATRGQSGTEPTGVPIIVIWGVVLFAFVLRMRWLVRRAREASTL